LRHPGAGRCAAMLVFLFAMQTATRTVDFVTPADPATASFDLATAKPSTSGDDRCGAERRSDDIVVCGSKKAMDFTGLPEFSERPVRATANIKGLGRLSVEGESRNVGGFTSKAATVKVKIPF
jgi:hypothetical protein